MDYNDIRETELFKGLNILLLEKNKLHLEVIKEKASLLANMEVDNSGLIRAFIEYFYKNQDELKDVIEYVKEYKGYKVLEDFKQMFIENKSDEEIEEKVGVARDITAKIRKRA